MESATIDIATDLRERFEFAAVWFLERDDLIHGVEHALPDKEAKAVEILKNLRNSIDAIPASLMETAEELRSAGPEDFEKWLVHGVQVVGFGFYPVNATEFLTALNNTLQRKHDQSSMRGQLR
jgi:hypothetical protein